MALTDKGGLAAISGTRDSARFNNSCPDIISFNNPLSNAQRESYMFPDKAISEAIPGPTRAPNSCDTPASGTNDLFTKTDVKRAASDPIRMSQERAIPNPAPAATPFTAAITGWGISRMCGAKRMMSDGAVDCLEGFVVGSSCSLWDMSATSAPEQKPRPDPTSTIARVVGNSLDLV